MRIKLLLILFAFPVALSAQREADCLAIGYCDFNPTPDCPPPWGSAIYKFNEEGIEYIEENAGLNLSTDYSRAAFSDRHTGELIFASNGWRLVNRSGQVLAHKLWRDDIPHPGNTPDTTAVLNSLGPLFLNDPGDSTKAYLFYGQSYLKNFPEFGGPAALDILFTYAYLDIPTQSLISKGNVVLNSLTARADMAACRHANGRDWWLIKPGIYEDENYIGILDPTGVRLQKKTYPDMQHRLLGGNTFTYFNQDGSKMLRFLPYKELHVYDFDRCSGELSNLVVHDLKDSLDILSVPDWNACNISPDGTKFYVRRSGGGTLQYNLETLEYTYITNISTAPQLTPNYKHILLGSRIITEDDSIYQTISTIYEPNEPGLDCNFVLNSDTVINIPNFISPSCFANFRLGRLEGSPCDTISSISQVKKEIHLQLYPNPAKDVLYVEFPYPNGMGYKVRIIDAMGRELYSGTMEAEGGSLMLSEISIMPGLYVLRAEREGKVYCRRFLVN